MVKMLNFKLYNLYLFLYFFAYHLATSGVPPVVRVPPVENRCSRVRHIRIGRTLEYTSTPHPGRMHSRVRHTRVGRTLEYFTPGL